MVNLLFDIFAIMSCTQILDWYHLRENLYKVGGSRPRLKQAETLLWTGKVLEVIALFKGLKRKQYARFINYLLTHRSRIINYQYYQEEGISSMGSGTVESMVKQIGARVKISGAQWNIENVPSILAVRCAYLNNQLIPFLQNHATVARAERI